VGIDIKLVEQLVALMNENDLTEVKIEDDDNKICLKKAGAEAPAAPVMVSAPMAPMAPMAAAPVAAPAAAPAAGAAPAVDNGTYIRSPIVGTFYRAPSPDDPPFCSAGDKVTTDSVVCIVEAMKVMNEIKADCLGEVLEVLVENGEPVEFGQPLFSVKTV
jgi:acetyl-CoA carboxylase biotin carboxyl carrier protein